MDPNNSLIGYRIMIHRMSTKTMREWYIKVSFYEIWAGFLN